MRIKRRLLPIKAHFFFFMCSMGPILPQFPVLGKELGISSAVMGSIMGVMPFMYLLSKPLFGMIVDVYRDFRKIIFIMLIIVSTVSFALLGFIPERKLQRFSLENVTVEDWSTCKETDLQALTECHNGTVLMQCTSNSFEANLEVLLMDNQNQSFCINNLNLTQYSNSTWDLQCTEKTELNVGCLSRTWSFWMFVLLCAIGSVGFNVTNSISDAICCDVIGDEDDYGQQRVWGTIGFGLTALMSGYVVDMVSGTTITYTPAFIIMSIFTLFDVLVCFKLKLPVIEAPDNIIKEFAKLFRHKEVVTFLVFAVCAGILDSLIIYYLFWYLEDLAIATNTTNIKLLEGLIVAAETLGGEIIFFTISGKILERFGHVHCFSMCFINYALRLGLISVAPNPWWILPIEFFFQGPTYALTYTTIVAYANELAPPGASATMQGIAAGMDDGVGYAIGSFIGGLMFKYVTEHKHVWQIFSIFGVICSIAHLILHKTLLSEKSEVSDKVEYKNPTEAIKSTYES